MSDLPARWWPIDGRDELRAELEAAYADPARGYHDTRHLTEVFARLDELAASVPYDRDPVLLAAWFHDARVRRGAGCRGALGPVGRCRRWPGDRTSPRSPGSSG